jgi:hypothetical protein
LQERVGLRLKPPKAPKLQKCSLLLLLCALSGVPVSLSAYYIRMLCCHPMQMWAAQRLLQNHRQQDG